MNKIVPCLKCDADDTVLISEIRKCVSCGEELEIDSPNNFENLRARLRDAESALIGMVEQYCHIQLAAGSDWMPELYGHAFMSAGEEAFRYLVNAGLAKWVDAEKIKFVNREE